MNNAYTHFSKKLITIIDKIAPVRKIRIKNRSQEWFDGEISNAIETRQTNFNKFKRTKQLLDEKLFKDSKYYARDLIKNKKKII